MTSQEKIERAYYKARNDFYLGVFHRYELTFAELKALGERYRRFSDYYHRKKPKKPSDAEIMADSQRGSCY